mgnify:CR=1 FL=1
MVKLEGLTQEEILFKKESERLNVERKDFFNMQIELGRITCDFFGRNAGDRVRIKINEDAYQNWKNNYLYHVFLQGIEIKNSKSDSSISKMSSVMHVQISPKIVTLKIPDAGSCDYSVHNPSKNLIQLYNPKYLDEALKLAEAYEKAGFGEFTVKKEYEE